MVIVIMGLVVLGLVLLQDYIYRKFWQEGLSLDIGFSSGEAFEGDTLFLYQDLTNKKILPLPWVLTRFYLSRNLIFEGNTEQSAELYRQSALFSIMMYQNIRRKKSFVCGRRGYYRLRNLKVTCNNLLHTRRFVNNMDCFSDLTVFPKILQDNEELDMLYKSFDAAMLSNSLINPDPFEFKGIREYQPTDPLRNINFKASAVAQQMMVNIHAPVSSKRLEIVLNVEYYKPYPNFELYEQGIRLAATIASRYINDDVKVGFYTNGADIYLGNQIRVQGGNSHAHLHSILQALARVDTVFKAPHIASYLEDLRDDGAVYLIISSYHGEDFLNALEDMRGRGLDYIAVIPVEKGEEHNLADTNKIKIWEAL